MRGDGNKPVIMRLTSGLGNQLFQYAVGRAVSLRLGVPLILDSRYYQTSIELHRPLLIDKFNIVAEISTKGDFPPLYEGYLIDKIPAALYRLRHAVVEERQLIHDTRVFSAVPGTYFRGYWQQEAYFSEIEETLREELTLRVQPSPPNQAMLEKIHSTPAVSVHVRRGDYLQHTNYFSCSMGYYARAAALIGDRTNQALTFFIFSDEPEWAAANLKLPGKMQLVNLNSDANSYEDLRLMSACQHNIIANSTFSWWGAWLNPNPEKIVIAPKTWYDTPGLSNERINARGFLAMDNLSP